MTDAAPRFISFEGIDGSGKSTQASLFADTLHDTGRPVLLTREPGGAPGAEAIRSLLVEGPTERWSPETEILLFTAARRDHLERTIRPALARGETVICDRFVDSTRVYQGLVRADLRALVDRLHELTIGLMPDLTIVLDIDPSEAVARATAREGREDRFERFGPHFQRDLAAGFRALAAAEPHRCRLVQASGSAEAVSRRVQDLVAARAP